MEMWETNETKSGARVQAINSKDNFIIIIAQRKQITFYNSVGIGSYFLAKNLYG